MLAAWPVPAEHVRVPTREGETFVVRCGPEDGSPLVLLHGSGSNAAMWMGDVPVWARHFRVHAVDVVGEPGLSAPARFELGGEAPAGWLDDVLDGLGLGPVALAGASLGGWLALDYAIRRPDRVARLSLLCPGGVGGQKPVASSAPQPTSPEDLRRSLKAVAGVDAEQAPAVAEYLTLIFTHFLPRRERLPRFDDEALRGLRMPVQVIVGARDAMLDSAETARRFRETVPHAQVTVLPEAGHWIPGQTDRILAFLRG
ncbi:alpha/beta fold hydrolase [Amycolatopsis bartoniae]|nr:alpha/beta fold hydrolase [Amycolatopsis bartoniae]